MRKFWLSLLLLTSLLLAGCSGQGTPASKERPAGMEVVPDWLYESVKAKFESSSVSVTKNKITMLRIHLKDSEKPQIAAYLTLDHLTGVFVLYEYQDGSYREVYVKNEPVYGVQVFGGGQQFLAFISGFGGTGVQENYFHLLGYTNGGYTEVWSDVAEQVKFSGPPPYYRVIGSISLSMDGQALVYSRYKEIFEGSEVDVSRPDRIKQDAELYNYNKEKGKFLKELD